MKNRARHTSGSSFPSLLGLALLALGPACPFEHGVLAQGYICAEGGGGVTGGTWAPVVFGWMVEKGQGGHVVILGASGSDPAIEAAFLAAGAASVTSLAVTSFNANLPATASAIAAADIVWMRGGDQAFYVNNWNNTLTEQAIRGVFDKGGVVGGTSAGCAVLGKYIYDAKVASVTPRQALQNPFAPAITFTDNFLELVPGVIFDTHFTERGRLGRLPVFVARLKHDKGVDVLGIGVDDRTALCVSPDGTAEVLGEGAVTILHRSPRTVQVLQSGSSPVITDLVHVQLTEGYRYDLATRQVLSRPAGAIMTSPPSGHPSVVVDVLLNGSILATANEGDVRVVDNGDDLALFLGKLQILDGNNKLLRTVLSAQTWSSTAFDENRVGGVQYAIASNPHFLGLNLDAGVRVQATTPWTLAVLAPTVGLESATLIVDGYGMVSRAFSTYISAANSVGPRQSVAIEGATTHLLRRDWSFAMNRHRPVSPAGVGDINLDGTVDGIDLGALLAAWGTDDAASDLDGDGAVDAADLGLLLGGWSAG